MSGAEDTKSGIDLELPLLNLPSVHPCHNCGECCNYVAVEIDNPQTFKDYENVFWYLTHRHISVYVDWEGDWFIEFETPCEHMTAGKTCGIYETRPHMCSDFSWNECEKTTQERAWKHRFETPETFFEFMRDKRPKQFARYAERRGRMLRKRERARAGTSQPSEAGSEATTAGKGKRRQVEAELG